MNLFTYLSTYLPIDLFICLFIYLHVFNYIHSVVNQWKWINIQHFILMSHSFVWRSANHIKVRKADIKSHDNTGTTALIASSCLGRSFLIGGCWSIRTGCYRHYKCKLCGQWKYYYGNRRVVHKVNIMILITLLTWSKGFSRSWNRPSSSRFLRKRVGVGVWSVKHKRWVRKYNS